MRHARTLLLQTLIAASAILATALFHPAALKGAASPSLSRQSPQQSPQASTQPAPTVASVADRDISGVEELIIGAAQAMPEDKFNFTPDTLHIPGADYKGVRSFAGEAKHIATSNWFIWSPLTGEKLPDGLKDGNGPANLQSKADIIQFLRDSFALGHRAAATLTTENMLQSPGKSKSTRLRLAEFGVAHAYDHYGQMVEYLRMNGIVPPASRDKSE
jgi:DinB superfamily